MKVTIQRLITVQRELTAKLDRGKISKNFSKAFKMFSKKFFPTLDLNEPRFKVMTHDKRMGWFKPKTQTIYLHPDATTDPDIFKSVSYHELIHYVDELIHTHVPGDGHGPFFKKYMDKINSVEGAGFITVKQDLRKMAGIATGKVFYIYYGKRKGTNNFLFTWAKKSNKHEPILGNRMKVVDKHIEGSWYCIPCSDKSLKSGKPLTKGASSLALMEVRDDMSQYDILKANYGRSEYEIKMSEKSAKTYYVYFAKDQDGLKYLAFQSGSQLNQSKLKPKLEGWKWTVGSPWYCTPCDLTSLQSIVTFKNRKKISQILPYHEGYNFLHEIFGNPKYEVREGKAVEIDVIEDTPKVELLKRWQGVMQEEGGSGTPGRDFLQSIKEYKLDSRDFRVKFPKKYRMIKEFRGD